MNVFKNPEVKKLLLITAPPSIIFLIVTAFFSPWFSLAGFLLCLFLISAFLIFTSQRYKRIESLTETINEILHGNDSINIKSYNEGELSILENEVQKMLVRLRDQKDILQKERAYLADSIADISHQLRTPLTSINLILSLLSSGDISEERRSELMRELSSLITKTEYLVSVLLKISKIDAGTVQFEKKEINLYELIKKSAEPVLIPMDIKNQSLVIDVGDIKFTGDFGWNLEAFGNILKNCAEHTPEGGTLTVRGEDTPIFTEITVEDTGNGFDEEDLPHIFERFYKGKNSNKDSFGIGLNLAKTIVARQNGTIKAENSNSGGAKFTVRFYKQVV